MPSVTVSAYVREIREKISNAWLSWQGIKAGSSRIHSNFIRQPTHPLPLTVNKKDEYLNNTALTEVHRILVPLKQILQNVTTQANLRRHE